MTKPLSLCGAIVLSTAAALAQTVIVPSAAANVEIGSTVNVWRAGACRVQCFYDSTNFTSQLTAAPITITAVEFRLANAIATNIVTYSGVQLFLSYSAVDYLSPSTTFASNRTLPAGSPTNFTGSVTTLPVAGTSPNGWFVNITLATPFVYDPSTGQDLLMELVLPSNPSPLLGNSISSGSNVPVHRANSMRFVGAGAATALTGTQSAFPPVVRFAYSPVPNAAFNVAHGQGCYQLERSFYETFAASSNDLDGKTVTMTKNANGGYDVITTVGAAVTAPVTAGLALGDDVVSPAIVLPFTFDYAGGSTNTIYVDSNGCLLLGGTGPSTTGASPASLLNAVTPRLAAAMTDLHPDGATNVANVFAGVDPGNSNVFLVTWNAVPCFNNVAPTGLVSTFQIALFDNATDDAVQFRYQTLVNDSTTNQGRCTTGFSLGAGAFDPGSSDLTAGPISTVADTPPVALTALSRPKTNSSWNLQVSNIPPSCWVVVSVFGLSDPGIDDAGIFGLPGCGLRSSLELLNAHLPAGPTLTYGLALPDDPTLNGVIFYTTAAAFVDPPQNPLGALTTNAIEGNLGLN